MKKIYNNSIVKIIDKSGIRYVPQDSDIIEKIEEDIERGDYEDYYYDEDRELTEEEMSRDFCVISQVTYSNVKYCAVKLNDTETEDERMRYFAFA